MKKIFSKLKKKMFLVIKSILHLILFCYFIFIKKKIRSEKCKIKN